MKKLYCVETFAVIDIVVAADSPEEARGIAAEGFLKELETNDVPSTETPRELATLSDVPAVWHGCVPYPEEDKIVFYRALHRKDIYRYFP